MRAVVAADGDDVVIYPCRKWLMPPCKAPYFSSKRYAAYSLYLNTILLAFVFIRQCNGNGDTQGSHTHALKHIHCSLIDFVFVDQMNH